MDTIPRKLYCTHIPSFWRAWRPNSWGSVPFDNGQSTHRLKPVPKAELKIRPFKTAGSSTYPGAWQSTSMVPMINSLSDQFVHRIIIFLKTSFATLTNSSGTELPKSRQQTLMTALSEQLNQIVKNQQFQTRTVSCNWLDKAFDKIPTDLKFLLATAVPQNSLIKPIGRSPNETFQACLKQSLSWVCVCRTDWPRGAIAKLRRVQGRSLKFNNLIPTTRLMPTMRKSFIWFAKR